MFALCWMWQNSSHSPEGNTWDENNQQRIRKLRSSRIGPYSKCFDWTYSFQKSPANIEVLMKSSNMSHKIETAWKTRSSKYLTRRSPINEFYLPRPRQTIDHFFVEFFNNLSASEVDIQSPPSPHADMIALQINMGKLNNFRNTTKHQKRD